MKLLTFEHGDAASWGALAGGEVADLGAATGYPGIVEALRADALAEAAAAVDGAPRAKLSEIGFLPVLGHPAKLVCIGLNYMVHVREMNRAVPTVPSLFLKYHDALVGHGREIVRPRVSDAFDFEGELAVVIGRAGRYIAEEDALSATSRATRSSTTARSATGRRRTCRPARTSRGPAGSAPASSPPTRSPTRTRSASARGSTARRCRTATRRTSSSTSRS